MPALLTADDREVVTYGLLNVINGTPSPRQMLASALPGGLRSRLGEGPPFVLVEQALVLCADDGDRDVPPAIVQLLRALLGDRDEITPIVARLTLAAPMTPTPEPPTESDPVREAEFRAVVDRLEWLTQVPTEGPASVSKEFRRTEFAGLVKRLQVLVDVEAGPAPPVLPVADPFAAVVLSSHLPFLGRSVTRRVLRGFLTDLRPIPRILVVNGESSRGTTYTTAFVDHVLADQARSASCRVTISPGQGAFVGPLELANDLVTNMGSEITGAPPANTNAQRWIVELVNWVLSVANGSDYGWWFVLDGFRTTELRPDTEQFVLALAARLGTGQQRERHRLILLDFDRTRLAVPPQDVAEEVTGPIAHAEVVRAVREIMATAPPQLSRDVVAGTVLDGLADPIYDLSELSVRLGALVDLQGAFT